MYIMTNIGRLDLGLPLSRLIQIGSVPIILRPAIPFASGTWKLIVRSRQWWCQFTEIGTRIAELISRLATDSAKNSETGVFVTEHENGCR